MTTSKPEVKIYEPSEKGATAMRKASFRNTGPNRYVRLTDYEALQAECEKLRKDADRYRWLMERGDDFQWENIIRLDIEDFPSRCAAIDAAMEPPK